MEPPAVPIPISGLQLFLLFTISGIIAGIWVYFDARRRAMSQPAIWATAVAFLFLFYFVVGLVALMVYLSMRKPTDTVTAEPHR